MIGSLVLSFVRCAATANNPSWFGILVYSEDTSNVTNRTPSELSQVLKSADKVLDIPYIRFGTFFL